MYLPGNLSLCEPHVHTWVGASGRRYDFAVARPATTWLDEAAVFLLVKRTSTEVSVLYIGHTHSLHRRFGHASQRCPEIWRKALAAGMTHVHLRFEPCSERERRAEVLDLKAVLNPSIDDPQRADEEEAALSVAAPMPVPAVPSAAGGDVLVLYRAKLKPTRHRDPHVDMDAFDADARRGDLPIGHGFEAPRAQRADPAREPLPDDALFLGQESTLADEGSDPDTVSDRGWVKNPDAVPEVVVAEPVEPVAKEPAAAVPPEATRRQETAAQAPAAPAARHASAAAHEADPAPAGPGLPAKREPRLLRFLSRVVGMAAAWRRGWVAQASAPRTPAPPVEQAPVVALPAAADAPGPQEAAEGYAAAPPADVKAAGDPADLSPAPPSIVDRNTYLAGVDEAAVSIGAGSPAPEPDDVPPSPDGMHTALQGEAASRGDVADDICQAAPAEAAATTRELGLDPAAPVVLFAGALSYEAGADIVVDAMITVCGTDASAQFVFAGEGALRAELEGRVVRSGLAHRCRFVGHVPAARFQRLLDACDFVVIPARVEQGEALAELALSAGKPAVVSHQSGIRSVVHGHNGLVTFDNPGSFVWGIREMLGPLHGKLRPRPAEAA